MNSEENIPRRLLFRIITDIVCLLIVGIPILIFFLVGKPYERGFFCDDESIRHPYLESTVPSWALYVFGLGLPIVTIIFTETILYKYSGKSKIVLLNREFPNWIWECYRHISVFGFGAVCSQLTTDIAKYTIGRLRPHFYSVCQPDVDCNNPMYKNVYIEHFTCKGSNGYLLKDMRLSFPSGHASFSTYCMFFLVAYMQAKIQWKGLRLLKHTLQFIAISLAFYTALSRISDYKHHWSDVLAGATQGAIVAILTVMYASDLVPSYKNRGKYPAESEGPDGEMKMGERREVEYSNSRML